MSAKVQPRAPAGPHPGPTERYSKLREELKQPFGRLLAFREPAQEAAWAETHTARFLARLRFGAGLTAAMNPVLLLLRLAVDSLDAEESDWNEVPLILVFPLCNFALGSALFWRAAWAQQRPRLLAAVCALGLLVALLDTSLAGEKVDETSLWVLMMYSLGICSFTGLPFHLSTGVVGVCNLAFIVMAWASDDTDTPAAGTITFALSVYTVLLGYLSFLWEASERRDFLLTDFLEAENANVHRQLSLTGWFSSGAREMEEIQHESMRSLLRSTSHTGSAGNKVAAVSEDPPSAHGPVQVPPTLQRRPSGSKDPAAAAESRHLSTTGSVLSAGCHVLREDLNIQESLGQGSFGEVFKGEYHDTTVAVKQLTMPADQAEAAAIMRELGAEAALMAEMRHPAVVMFMGVCVEADFVALVMEFCPRGSLYGVLHDQKYQSLDKSLVIRLMVNTAHGMTYLHGHQPPVVHCDFKSLNLLVDADWHCKVADFGLSAVKSAHVDAQAVHNNPRHVVGSVVWAAPELFEGEEPSQAADVYSFGVVLFEVINHSLPYAGLVQESVPHLVAAGRRPEDYEPFRQPEDERMLALEALARECWSGDPLRRPAFADILHRLQDLAADVVGDKTCAEGVMFPGQRSMSVVGTASTGSGGSGGGAGAAAAAAEGFPIQPGEVAYGKQIGSGSYAAVFEGTYFGTHVAVKKLFIKGVPGEVLDEFRHECAIMMELRHPNIVLFMGSCCQMPELLLVTELMARGSLYDVYRHHDKPEGDTLISMGVRIAYDMSCGLSYLHNHHPPIMHRDLKSPNVFLDDALRAKIGDFGFAKVKDASKTMSMCGSPLWIAPEIISGEDYGLKCDVYSFAIILWEIFHWGEPYPGMSSREVMHGVSEGRLRPSIAAAVPPAMRMLMQRCWEQDADQRPDFGQIIQEVERGAEALGVSL